MADPGTAGGARGGFVLVVGPSGAGKDMVIAGARAELARDPRFVFPRRLVTRPPSVHEDNAEITEAAFARGVAEGTFPLHWRAHGLGYAIPAEALAAAAQGRVVVCNVSRRVVEAARRALPGVHVVAVTAAPEILAERLAARERPQDGDLAARLARAVRDGGRRDHRQRGRAPRRGRGFRRDPSRSGRRPALTDRYVGRPSRRTGGGNPAPVRPCHPWTALEPTRTRAWLASDPDADTEGDRAPR